MAFFSSQGLLIIFTCFEMLTLPVVFMVYGWGSQPEKVGALYYMLGYTGRFSISFLYVLITFESWEIYVSPLVSFYIVGMFAVKCPIYGLHL